jgi:glycosyltransferase involved in cell wall biosynthesis
MSTPSKTDIDRLKASGLFDGEWYRATYPDVSTLRMDPAEHYLRYGRLLGRVLTDGEALDLDLLDKLEDLPAPKPSRALLEAHEFCRADDDALGLAYARRHVPAELSYTIETLKANAALRRKDEAGWLRHLNAYLAHFNVAPIRLGAGPTLLDRFATAPLSAVTGGPLITVIMPAWNAEKTVRAAACSILEQTWRNLELLIVDDFSTDGTWAELQRLAAEDTRVKILRNAVNVGPYVSKNIALELAQGAWITGHDADDWAHPQRLERHMRALQQFGAPPRASVGSMLRFEPDGMMDRFAPVSDYSLDGAARDAAISCTYDAGFLKQRLGSWDCIRFGADSELIARTQALIGEEFKRLPQISMLCMNFEGSLTNNPDYGVTRTAGPSQIRIAYSNAWRAWHKTLAEAPQTAQRLAFPPAATSRPFPAPEAARVPLHDIRRNYALHTGHDPACGDVVTVICASKRPHFAERVARMMGAQTHANLHLIYVAHGPGHDLEVLRKTFLRLKSVELLALPDAEQTLGTALNLALDHCQTDLCAKIDDDDFYGPNYIRASLAALHYCGHDGVGIVGRERAYVYVEERDMTALRQSASHENSLRSRVYGGTIFWSRKALADQRFALRNTGEDSDFFKRATDKGIRIFSAEAADYIHVRYSDPGAHTWQVTADDFLRTATPLANGLRLDLAYSSVVPAQAHPVPQRPEVSDGMTPKPNGPVTS